MNMKSEKGGEIILYRPGSSNPDSRKSRLKKPEVNNPLTGEPFKPGDRVGVYRNPKAKGEKPKFEPSWSVQSINPSTGEVLVSRRITEADNDEENRKAGMQYEKRLNLEKLADWQKNAGK